MTKNNPGRLVLIRHGEAAHRSPDGRDFARPLTSRGQHTIKLLGHALAEDNLVPDLIFTSPARRTTETAAIIGNTVGFRGIIQPKPELYNCHKKIVYKLIRKFCAEDMTIFISGHNPSISTVPGELIPEYFESLRQGGAVALAFTTTEPVLQAQLVKHYSPN